MGTHPIFESDFDCLTEREEVGWMLPRAEDYPDFDPVILRCIGLLHVGGKEARRGLKELRAELLDKEQAHGIGSSSSRGASPSILQQKVSSPVKTPEAMMRQFHSIPLSPSKVQGGGGGPVMLSNKEIVGTMNDKRKG